MNNDCFLPGGIYYCHRCGHFFDWLSKQLVDIPYSEVPAELALQAMQARTKNSILCHIRQRSKLKNKGNRGIIHLNYRGYKIDCWRKLDRDCKDDKNFAIWAWAVDDMQFEASTVFEAVAKAKQHVDWLITEQELSNLF